jgi:hypothetical protein
MLKIKRNYNRGFTLAEMLTVMTIFMIAILVIVNIFVNLVKSTLIANDYYQSLENIKIGTDKIFEILKLGFYFKVLTTSTLEFKDIDCVTTTISYNQSSSSLEIIRDPEIIEVFDNNLVKVKGIMFATDTPSDPTSSDYRKKSNKIIIIFYDLEIYSRSGVTSSLKFQQAVAPLNSIVSSPSCKE